MKIDGHNFKVENTLDSSITVPDSFVMSGSKIGRGNGEAKLYIAPKGNFIVLPFLRGDSTKGLRYERDEKIGEGINIHTRMN